MDNLVRCYHDLLKLEYQKIYENGYKLNENSMLTQEEVKDTCRKFNINFYRLLKEKLIIKYPSGGFRTVHYDLIYRMINIRAFPFGSRIPLEYAIYQFEDYLPDFKEVPLDEVQLRREIKNSLFASGINSFSKFQLIYINEILRGEKRGYVISSPTGSGKTFIFLIPVLNAALENKTSFLIYPRKALASDQLSKILDILLRINEILKIKKIFPITIGIDDGDTPRDEKDERAKGIFRGVKCPLCKENKKDVYLKYVKDGDKVIVKCENGHIFNFILPTRKDIWNSPPKILITNAWTLNRRLMDRYAQKLFAQRVEYLIFDEAHVYKEELGGHLHFVINRLMKKLKRINGYEPKIILSSATLPEMTLLSFVSELTGISKEQIFWKNYRSFLSKKRKRMIIHLVLLPNPFKSAEVLSENILLLLLIYSTLRKKKSLFFVDSVHEVYRLFHFVNVILTREIKRDITRALEHFESDLTIDEPFYYGHYSNEKITEKDKNIINIFQRAFGYHHGGLSKDRRYKIEEEFRRGKKNCLVTTSTLELGIDIGDISIIGQYRYPLSGESYIQRVGRAGRSEKSLYVVLSILILSNSPSQIRYLYGENTQSIFELPPDYYIPISLENEVIRQQHTFFEILDILAQHGRRTFINTKDIKDYWRNKDYSTVIESLKRMLKDGKIYSESAEQRNLLEAFLQNIRRRESILNLISSSYEVEVIPSITFRIDRIDPLEEIFSLVKEIYNKIHEIPNIPEEITYFFNKIIDYLEKLFKRLENAYIHFRDGSSEAFEQECKLIEKISAELNSFVSPKMIKSMEESLHKFAIYLLEKNADKEDRNNVMNAINLIHKIEEYSNEKGFQISYGELINYFYDVILEINHFLRDPSRWFQFDITKALNVLGVKNTFSLLFDKPLPKVYLRYLGLPKQEEYFERTIDKLLWIATPLRIIPIEYGNKKWFFTTIFGLSSKRHRVFGPEGFNPLEGGDTFTFKAYGRKFIARTPHIVNMINLDDYIIEAKANIHFSGKDSRISSQIILSNKVNKYQIYRIDKLHLCLYGFLISARQNNICPRSQKECPLYHKCRGRKYFIRPKSEYDRISYLSVIKIYPNFYIEINEPTEFVEEFLPFRPDRKISLKIFHGGIFKKAITGCYLLPTGKFTNFLCPPYFILDQETLGYTISSNGIYVHFDNKWLESILREILRETEVKSWIILKYLISKKYFTERGDLKLEWCQKALKGLYSSEGTKIFSKDFQKLYNSREIPNDLIKFAKFIFLHSFAHLMYEFLIEKLRTAEDNLAIYIDTDNSRIFIIENAERGLGLTQTLLKIVQKEGENKFFLEMIDKMMTTIVICENSEKRIKEVAKREINSRLNNLSTKEKEIFNEMRQYVKTAMKIVKEKYKIHLPIEILRNILVEKYGNYPYIADAIILTTPYCWDGCYNDIRLERGCKYDPFRQMIRVSKSLLMEVLKRIIDLHRIKLHVRVGFEWILREIEKTRNTLRISSPWISPNIVEEYLLPLLSRGIKIEIITRRDLLNVVHMKALKILKEWSKSYRNLKLYIVDNLHAKMIIIDDKVAFEGSLNLTWRGIYENVELVREYRERGLIERFNQEFERLKNLSSTASF